MIMDQTLLKKVWFELPHYLSFYQIYLLDSSTKLFEPTFRCIIIQGKFSLPMQKKISGAAPRINFPFLMDSMTWVESFISLQTLK